MRADYFKRTGLVLVVTVVLAGTVGYAQGNLNPSSAPGATMKTLDQVEPRIPISSAPVTLSAPGSYYLTTNLSGTVTIAADNVTLDLMGFAIIVSSGNGISQSGKPKNTHIQNGVVRSSEANGLDLSTSDVDANSCIENLRVAHCGVYGIAVGGGYLVKNCLVEGCSMGGIGVYGNSEIRDCKISGCARGIQCFGAGALIDNNRVYGNTDNYDLTEGNQLNLLLCEIPETLDWPCSVTFAGTLICTNTGVNGITVAANDVTIDMAGHTLVGPGASSGHGIYQANTYRNLRVFNGKAVEWRGSGKGGIYAGSSAVLTDLQASTNSYGILAGNGSTLSDCTAYMNGVVGIYVGDGNTLSDCTAQDNGDDGINAGFGSTLSGCTAYDNGDDGIATGWGSTLSDCAAYENDNKGIYAGSGNTLSGCVGRNNDDVGIYAAHGSTLSGCTAYDNGDTGIYADSGSTLSGCAAHANGDNGIYVWIGSTVSDCAASYNTGDGIQIYTDARVVGCVCDENGSFSDGAGIHAIFSDNHIEGNNCTGNDRGIDVDGAGNFIVKNTCSGNTLNWDVAAGNACLVIQATTGGAISGNSGGAGLGSTNPNANFTY